MTLREAVEEKEYKVQNINTEDEELNAFLFSLGCYSGEPITVISRKKSGLVVSIKDGRYNIDPELSSMIEVSLTEDPGIPIGGTLQCAHAGR